MERPKSWRKVLHDTCGEPALQKIKEEIRTPSLLKIRPIFTTPSHLRDEYPGILGKADYISAITAREGVRVALRLM